MRPPRVRFTLRFGMVVVAIVAMALGPGWHAVRWINRRESYVLLAEANSYAAKEHSRRADMLEESAKGWAKRADAMNSRGIAAGSDGKDRHYLESRTNLEAEYERRCAAHYDSQARGFLRAARFPWGSVPKIGSPPKFASDIP